MTGYTYTTFVQALAELMVVSTSDTNFQNILPSVIDYTENRIQRDVDFLATVFKDTSVTLAANNRNFTIPSTMLVVEEVNVITPVGSDPDVGTRNALVPATKEYLDFTYNSATGASIPLYFAPITDVAFIVGPWPAANYGLELVGTRRLTQLSESNPSNYISLVYPDLYLAAAMVFATGYQKNFGSQADDPQMSQSWENQYQKLLQSTILEDERRGFQSSGWVSKAPAPIATPTR